MSHRKKRSSVDGSRKVHDEKSENTAQPQETEPEAEHPQNREGQNQTRIEGGDMQEPEEEMGRTIERTSIALGHLLQVVESTSQQLGRLAEEQQNSISFFASLHKYLKAQESEARYTTSQGDVGESMQQ